MYTSFSRDTHKNFRYSFFIFLLISETWLNNYLKLNDVKLISIWIMSRLHNLLSVHKKCGFLINPHFIA